MFAVIILIDTNDFPSGRVSQQDAKHHGCGRTGCHYGRAALRDPCGQAEVVGEKQEGKAGGFSLRGDANSTHSL